MNKSAYDKPPWPSDHVRHSRCPFYVSFPELFFNNRISSVVYQKLYEYYMTILWCFHS